MMFQESQCARDDQTVIDAVSVFYGIQKVLRNYHNSKISEINMIYLAYNNLLKIRASVI